MRPRFDGVCCTTLFLLFGGSLQAAILQPPVAVDDPLSYTYGSAAPVFDPRVNDSDPNNLPLTVIGVSPPQFGTASFTGTSITYTPPAFHVAGVDAFAYNIQNSAGLTASAVVQITLINPAPIANPDSLTTAQNTAGNLDPRANDSDPAHLPLTITAVGAAAHGAAVINSGTSVTYTPATGYWGPDAFGYTITNSVGLTASSSVAITVTAAPPVPGPVNVSTPTNTAVTYNPTLYATDPNNLPLSTVSVGAPSHGTAVVNSGISVTYTPASGYTGTDSFPFTIANTGGGSAGGTATVNIGAVLTPAVSAANWNWVKVGSNPAHNSANVVASATGGQSPYTFAWLYVSGDTAISPTSVSSASTAFTRTMTVGTTYSAVWSCRVTDAQGTIVYSPLVTVKFTWTST